jgi:hypothetical protein
MKVRGTIYRVEGVFAEVISTLVRRGWIRIYSFFSSGKVMAKQKNSSVISVG